MRSTPLIQRRFLLLYAALFAAFLLFGVSMTMVGAALPKILPGYGWGKFWTGMAMAASPGAFIPASLASGPLIRRFGAKAAAAMGLGLCSIGLALVGIQPSWLPNMLLFAVIGAGQGLLEPGVNWSVLRMDEGGSGRAMNLMHGAFAVGAVLGPVALGALLSIGVGWMPLFRAVAALFALLALTLLALPFSALPPQPDSEPHGRPAADSRPLMMRLGSLALFLYVGVEVGISTWLAVYFVEVFHATPPAAAIAISLFWVGLLAGRFGVPALYRGRRSDLLLVLASTLAFVCMAGIAAAGFSGISMAAALAPAFVFLAGLGCSIVYPTTVTMASACYGSDQAKALGFVVAGGGLGSFAFPFAITWLMENSGIRAGFAGYAIAGLLSAVASFAVAAVYRAEGRRRGAPS